MNSLDTQVGIRVEDNERFGTHTVGQGAVRYQILPIDKCLCEYWFRIPCTNHQMTYMQCLGGNTLI